ncbi:TniB family NTP-binding protein [Kordiimonas laminariae]|uniref:TniB family NTP-binding protein n=1 Tax=Kordiimonas laminariae TaxID=2917717 RepID=UPI001FF36883|nr:TniB family NTP-binding protein [Kordiimonas laminariae]MCK0069415.1 TniB family NTP-binding protein [Kordiimonas laminariae]
MKTSRNSTRDGLKPDAYTAMQQLVIEHPQIKRTIARIDEYKEASKGSREPNCMLILGRPGVGKTTIKDLYTAKYAIEKTDTGTKVPVLSATIPVPATMMTLVTALLTKIGDPLAVKGTLHQKTLRLYRLLKECETEMILLDEFHHFIDCDSEKILNSVSNWLKNLISETKVPVTLIGLPKSLRVLFANSQLERRFSDILHISPIKYPSANNKDFKHLLKIIQEHAILKFDMDLTSEDMLPRMYAATNGYLSPLMLLVRMVTFSCKKQGKKTIELKDMAEFHHRKISAMSKGNPNLRTSRYEKNPFSLDWTPADAVKPSSKSQKPAAKRKPPMSKAEASREIREIYS